MNERHARVRPPQKVRAGVSFAKEARERNFGSIAEISNAR
jgi:hypothetical protein